MSVGVQGEAGGEVAQHTGQGLDVNAILQGYRGKGVSEVVESDLRDTGSCQHPLEHIVHAVRRNRPAIRGGEDVLIVRLCPLLL